MVDRAKIGKKARRKGTNYERKVAKELTKITGYNWRRVPYSGASYIPGDVTIVDEGYEFQWVVELKNRKDLNLQKVFKNPLVLKPYFLEADILIFNSNGQSVVVVSPNICFASGYPRTRIRFDINGDCYIGFDIKYFDKIIRKEE